MLFQFIKKVIFLSLVPLITIVSFDFWLRNQNSLYKVKYEGLIQQKDSIDVLFLGNSHANYGIDPIQIDRYNAYNLANVSQKIYFDRRLTLKAIREGVSNLKVVCISMDYHSLYTSSQGARNSWSYYANGIKYKDSNYLLANASPFIWGYTPRVSLALLIKSLIRRLKYPNTTIDYDVERGVDLNDSIQQGYLGYEGTRKEFFNDNGYRIRALSFQEPHNSERKEVLADLEDFITELKEIGIQPILYSLPTYKDYNQFLDQSTLQQNQQDIDRLCESFDIEHWNYMFDERFEKNDFYNCDHLNKIGAEKVSKLISNRLNGYLD